MKRGKPQGRVEGIEEDASVLGGGLEGEDGQVGVNSNVKAVDDWISGTVEVSKESALVSPPRVRMVWESASTRHACA